MDRNRVYELIDGERDYQDNLGSDRVSGVKHTRGRLVMDRTLLLPMTN